MGLAMEQLETEWTQYPVIKFDLSIAKSSEIINVEDGLSRQLRQYEAIYGRDEESRSFSSRMADLIYRANAQTGQKVVVLIDEYDAPILEVLHDEGKREKVRHLLREFYSPLKSCDRYLRFVFLTGISMFSQLSIFSELNNLKIISSDEKYSSICGITLNELLQNFQYGINKFADKLHCSTDEVVLKLKDAYDGYHFSQGSVGVFNPYSLLNAFDCSELGNFWFASGTPRALLEMLKKYQQQGKFNVEILDSSRTMNSSAFESPLEMQDGPIPLLYQAGYLTIKDYDPEANSYSLTIPNSEVRIGLLKNLLPLYYDVDTNDVQDNASHASVAFRKGEPGKAIQLFQSVLSSMPFLKGDKAILADAEKTEAYYHRLFYFYFRMLCNEVTAEVRSAKGACDIVIKTPKYIYVVEIKIDSSSDVALRQIEENGYAAPYLTDGRQVIKLGINFSTETRTVSDWKQA
jgi:hypothetical protein